MEKVISLTKKVKVAQRKKNILQKAMEEDEQKDKKVDIWKDEKFKLSNAIFKEALKKEV